MKSYMEMLDELYSKLKNIVKHHSGERKLELPLPKVTYQKNWTIFLNVQEFAKVMNRDTNIILRFLRTELNAPIKEENKQFVILKKVESQVLRRKMEKFAKEFVICPVCGKPDTILIKNKGIYEIKCMACGATSPVLYSLK